ncbi:DUF5701 family protein [Demequina sp.]|uniref:DUF5701 family protein n=1 Tax=Demequina sp. TaxID=2050685 RepID=UPI003D0FB5D2
MPEFTATLESQVDAYVSVGYPQLAGLTEDAFRALFGALEPVDEPALAVVTAEVIPAEARVPALRIPGSAKEGILDRNHGEAGLAPYAPVVDIPEAPVYWLYGIDRGDEFLNVAPRDALPAIAERGRTPLTIDEGLSLATVAPHFVEKNHCFMLAGSRRGDKRVPAIWISQRAPKLGWCFEGVPHTWLGIASAAGRAG